jgi:hypothetical protein
MPASLSGRFMRRLLLSISYDAAGNTCGLKGAFRLLATLQRAASLGAIPSWLAPFLLVQVRADFRDARAAEAIPRL